MMPVRIGDSDTTWTIMLAASEDYILKDINEMTLFTIILLAVALAIAALIVYFTLHATTHPIVAVAETLKDISEGEGDLTQSISVD
jgi:methyl-accepting chemotaxis protein